MSKFEKKFGKFALKNISVYMVACYGIGYLLQLINPGFLYMLTLNPYEIIFNFQIWRLFTWVLIPPAGLSVLVLLILFAYWSIGTSLERTWGTYRYNVYLFTGFLCTVLGSFLYFGFVFLQLKMLGVADADMMKTMLETTGLVASVQFSTYYVNMSIFLLFAFTFPEAQMLLAFIIPVKAKWLGIAYGIYLGYCVVSNFFSGLYAEVIVIVISLLNFLIFFIKYKRRRAIKLTPKQVKRRVVYRAQTKKTNTSSRHKCAICGRTEADGDELEFRYCSKCNGNYEYCQDHLFTHTHVQ